MPPQVDLVYSPLVDAKEFPEDVDITLVEGAVSSEEDLHKIKIVRERTKTLVSLGDCAVTANVPSMRNPFGVKADLRSRLSRERDARSRDSRPGRAQRCCPRRVPVHEVVTVDVFVPGCPPSADIIYYVVSELLEGRTSGIELEDAVWSVASDEQ